MSDSAGIRIVENPARGTWAEGAGWTVADSPSVTIGGGAGGPEYEFSQIVGVALLSDGRFAVADGATSEVRFYDSAGQFQSAHGRRGSGPGEYESLVGLWRGPHDSLLIADMMVQRLAVVDSKGVLGRHFSLGGRTGLDISEGRVSLAIPQGWFADGSVLGPRCR